MKSNPSKQYVAITLAASILALAASFVLSGLGLTLLAVSLGALIAAGYFFWIFKTPLLGLLTVVFLLPFERIGSIDLSGVTVRPSQIVALVTIVAFLWQQLASKKFSFQKNPMVIPTVAFLLSNLISLFFAINFTRGVEVFVFTTFVAGVSFVVPQIVTTKEHVEKLVRILMISAVLVSLFGIYQFIGDLIGLPPTLTGLGVLYTKAVFGFPRIQSTAAEPLYFANYLLIPIGVALSLLLNAKKQNTFWWLVVIMLFVVNFLLTLSRGGYVGFVGLVIVLAIAHYKHVFSKKNLALYGIIFGVAAVAFGFLIGFSSNAREAVNTFWGQAFNFSSGASIEERQGTVSQALWQFAGHPIFGIGPGNFGPAIAERPLVTPTAGWLIVNNETIELLTETGIVGLTLFVLVLAIVFFRSIRAFRAARDPYIKNVLAGLLAAFVAVFIQYQSFSTLFVLHVWVLMGLLVAVQNIALRREVPSSQSVQEGA